MSDHDCRFCGQFPCPDHASVISINARLADAAVKANVVWGDAIAKLAKREGATVMTHTLVSTRAAREWRAWFCPNDNVTAEPLGRYVRLRLHDDGTVSIREAMPSGSIALEDK